MSALFISLRATAASEGARSGTFPFGGLERTYRVYRPASLSRDHPVPLVVMLHGGYGTGAQAEAAYHWDATADAHSFVVLYPDGVRRAWNAGDCCRYPQRAGIDDVGFISALVDRTVHDENIDRRRIYVTGMSNGAFLSYALACNGSFPIAAIGPVAGTLVTTCTTARPTSVLAIHGLADDLVPFAGGRPSKGPNLTEYRVSVPETIARWQTIDRCGSPSSVTQDPVTKQIAQCAAGREVELVTIAAAGHQWPGSTPRPGERRLEPFGLAPPSRALDATATLWAFFAAHPG